MLLSVRWNYSAGWYGGNGMLGEEGMPNIYFQEDIAQSRLDHGDAIIQRH